MRDARQDVRTLAPVLPKEYFLAASHFPLLYNLRIRKSRIFAGIELNLLAQPIFKLVGMLSGLVNCIY